MAGDLIVDADGSIWAISKYLKEGGLVRFNQNTGNFEHIHLQADAPVDTRGLSMMQDSGGLIWIGTWDNGLIAFDPHTFRVVRRIEGDSFKLTPTLIYTRDGVQYKAAIEITFVFE